MYVLMQCVAEAVVAKGVRGLVEMVPGGAFLYDVSNEALRRMRDRQRADQLRDEVMRAAGASFEEAKQVAERVAREVAAGGSAEDRIALELYLSQIPAAVRQSLKRADDPSGKSVPANFALDEPTDLLRRLPARLPRFRSGDALPGKPGWQLVELLGTGGFGEVWLARNPALSALKGAVKFGLDPQARERLLRHEGALVSRVMEQGRHPNVVQLLDAHLEGDAPWLMYEYVPGGDLIGLIHAWQKLPPDERVRRTVAALHTLAAAVGHFHRLGPPLVHRDLKPANVLVSAEGGGRNAEWKTEESRRGSGSDSALRPPPSALLVTDFGIGGVAAAASLSEASRRSSSGVLVSHLWGSHTPLYASPQQQRGEPPDPRDDVHALGVIGFQMLTGRLDATPGADYAKTLRRQNVPEPLVELLGDCAAHDPRNRPTDAAELADRLAKLAAPPAPSRPLNRDSAERPRPVARPVRREAKVGEPVPVPGKRSFPMSGCFLAVLGLVIVVLLLYSVRTDTATLFPAKPAEQVARVSSFGGINGRVHALAYSATGNRLLATTDDGTVYLFNQDDGKQVLKVPTGVPGHRPAFSPDGSRLAAAGPDNRVKLWDTTTGQERDTLTGLEEKPVALAYSPDGRSLVAGGSRGAVMLWTLADKKSVPLLVDAGEAVTAVVFDPKGRQFATAGGNHVRLWEGDGRTGANKAFTTDAAVTALAFTPDGSRLVAVGTDGRPRSWDVNEKTETVAPDPKLGAITQLVAFPDNRHAVVVYQSGDVGLWDATSSGAVVPFHPRGGRGEAALAQVKAASLNPTGGLLATGGGDGSVLIWEMSFRNLRARMTAHGAPVLGAAFSPDGKKLATADATGTVIVWNVPPIEPDAGAPPVEVR